MEVYSEVEYKNVDASAGATFVVELEVPFEHMAKVYMDLKTWLFVQRTSKICEKSALGHVYDQLLIMFTTKNSILGNVKRWFSAEMGKFWVLQNKGLSNVIIVIFSYVQM